ncbi:MAG: polysaccharide deacetylase family protein [Flavobacteriaceae bacterium]|nr:polysaccharide deacetylase family protein [Flavobacteriaceae bacterium]
MLLIYTHKITPRISYIFKHILFRMLNIPVQFTTKTEEFIPYKGPKISYVDKPILDEISIKPHFLLFQQGVSDVEINVSNWEDVPCFFQTNAKGIIPYDIFAASFYLISRYEEYLPHVLDQHLRFSGDNCLAKKYHFLEKPVIDIWVLKLLQLLKNKFPNLVYQERKFNYLSTIDVDLAISFKQKGIIRFIIGFFKDFINFNLINLKTRTLVLLNLQKDPFDTFDQLREIQEKYQIKTHFFFLLADYTTFDTNNSVNSPKFQSLIKSVADFAQVGIHPSYFTMKNFEKLKKEVKRLEEIINRPVKMSRQHFLRLKLPDTYHHLIDLEIAEDYTMGYSKHPGFRASTCTPFYFFDLDYEIQTPLRIIPFAVMDATLNEYMHLKPEEGFQKIIQLLNEVKSVNGTFVTLFHNDTLSENKRWKGWSSIYERVVKQCVAV